MLRNTITGLPGTLTAQYFFNLLVFFLIFILIYNPKYNYSLEKLSMFGYESFHEYHHVTFFLIPIHEILSGKTLLFNVSSLYGIFSTYINSFIFSFVKLTYSNFVLYSTYVSIIYLFLFFIILKRLTKSFLLALLGTLAYIRLAFFRTFPPEIEVFIFPSTTPIRYFFDIIALYLISQYFRQVFSLKRLFFLSTVIVFAFFYNFDFGLFILISYISVLFFDVFLSFFHSEKFYKIILKIDYYLLSLVFPFILFTLLIILYTYFRSGNLPDFGQYLFHISTQAIQLKDRTFPTNVIGWQFFPFPIYLFGFYYVFYQNIIKKRAYNHEFVFLLAYGILTFTSYINLSEPNHLFPYLHPAIIMLILLLKVFIDKLAILKKNIFIFFCLIFFFIGFFWTIYMYPKSFISLIAEKINSRYSKIKAKYYYWNYPGADFYLQDDDGKNFKLAVDKIKQYAKNDQEIVIISRYSALLHLMSGKTSLINHPNIENDIYSTKEFYNILNIININQPKYIFVHSSNYSQWYADIMNILWNKIKIDYVFKENSGALDVYQRITSPDRL
jgi:hypothetical protein